MPDNGIGLAELIQQVEADLFSFGPGTGNAPFFFVEQVTLELQVKVSKKGEAGLRIHVIEAGVDIGKEDVHTIKVTLDPLMEKKDLIEYYMQHVPGGAQALLDIGVRSMFKGDSQESQEDTFN